MTYVKTEWVNGETPINANNLNKIENQLELNANKIDDKNIITVGLSSNQSITSTTEVKINLNTILNQVGTELTFDTVNKSIVIGSGISYILISAQALCNTFTTNGLRRIIIKKNNDGVARAMNYYTQNFNSTIVISPMLVPVSEGDVITLATFNNGATTIYGNVFDTYMTVQVVK